MTHPSAVQLAQYSPSDDYSPGKPLLQQLLWYYLGSPLVMSHWLPFSRLKTSILRLFGASIGTGVRLKPDVRIKFPWRLTVGNHCWLGESVWIDNLAPVTLESNVCLSQGVYLCTGNHDWGTPTFDLRLGNIYIHQSAWISAKAVVGPGVIVGEGAFLTLASVANASLESWTIYTENPAKPVKKRSLTQARPAEPTS